MLSQKAVIIIRYIGTFVGFADKRKKRNVDLWSALRIRIHSFSCLSSSPEIREMESCFL